jgi:SAM-dependent methyltransferase
VDFDAGIPPQAHSAHAGARWVRSDARALPFAAEFDLVVSFGALGHFLPAERPALFAGVHRALRPGGVFAFPVGAQPPVTSARYWALLGFDLAMRARNAVRRPPFVMYYRTCPLPALRRELTAAGFAVSAISLTAGRCQLVLARASSGC